MSLVNVATLEIAQLMTAQTTGTQEVYQGRPVLRLKMPIVLFDTAGPGDAGPGSARDSDTGTQGTIIEEQPQRRIWRPLAVDASEL